MHAFRNGKRIIVCDGCHQQIKRPKALHDLAGMHPTHAHVKCRAKVRVSREAD